MEVKYACRVRSCQKDERRPANNCEKLSGELEGNCSGYLSAELCCLLRIADDASGVGVHGSKMETRLKRNRLCPTQRLVIEIGFKFRVSGGENCLE